jgi:hypothetical protein
MSNIWRMSALGLLISQGVKKCLKIRLNTKARCYLNQNLKIGDARNTGHGRAQNQVLRFKS